MLDKGTWMPIVIKALIQRLPEDNLIRFGNYSPMVTVLETTIPNKKKGHDIAHRRIKGLCLSDLNHEYTTAKYSKTTKENR